MKKINFINGFSFFIILFLSTLSFSNSDPSWNRIVGNEMCQSYKLYVKEFSDFMGPITSRQISVKEREEKIKSSRKVIFEIEHKAPSQINQVSSPLSLIHQRTILFQFAALNQKDDVVREAQHLTQWCKDVKWKQNVACLGVSEISTKPDDFLKVVKEQIAYMEKEGVGTKWIYGEAYKKNDSQSEAQKHRAENESKLSKCAAREPLNSGPTPSQNATKNKSTVTPK